MKQKNKRRGRRRGNCSKETLEERTESRVVDRHRLGNKESGSLTQYVSGEGQVERFKSHLFQGYQNENVRTRHRCLPRSSR